MKPILFSTPMVQAILDGRKTMTRRVMNPQPLFYTGRKYVFADDVCPKKWEDCDNIIDTYQYQPGDILWVRETWNAAYNDNARTQVDHYIYKTDKPSTEHWRPSIFMPRKAARIFLRVTDIRVERLQDITGGQAIKEGVPTEWPMEAVYCHECKGEGLIGTCHPVTLGYMEIDCPHCETPAKRFRSLWDSINGKRGYGWDINPWVWVISFERINAAEVTS